MALRVHLALLAVLHPAARVTCSWSISRRVDNDSCAKVRSSNVHIEVFLAGNSTGLFDHAFDAPCMDFVTTMDLLPGGYYAFATLQDTNGQPRGIVTARTPKSPCSSISREPPSIPESWVFRLAPARTTPHSTGARARNCVLFGYGARVSSICST